SGSITRDRLDISDQESCHFSHDGDDSRSSLYDADRNHITLNINGDRLVGRQGRTCPLLWAGPHSNGDAVICFPALRTIQTCFRGKTSVCPSATGKASGIAIACSASIQIRSRSTPQKGQDSNPSAYAICARAEANGYIMLAAPG